MLEASHSGCARNRGDLPFVLAWLTTFNRLVGIRAAALQHGAVCFTSDSFETALIGNDGISNGRFSFTVSSCLLSHDVLLSCARRSWSRPVNKWGRPIRTYPFYLLRSKGPNIDFILPCTESNFESALLGLAGQGSCLYRLRPSVGHDEGRFGVGRCGVRTSHLRRLRMWDKARTKLLSIAGWLSCDHDAN